MKIGDCYARDDIDSYASIMSQGIADGFDFPVGDVNAKGKYRSKSGAEYTGWYVATHTGTEYALGVHTGEDWNGNGGGNTDLGQPVYSIAMGVVVAAGKYAKPWGNIVMIKHNYLENHKIKQVYSVYAHLDSIKVQKGDSLARRQLLGTIGTGEGAYPAHLHIEIRKQSLASFPVNYWPSDHGKNVDWVKNNYLDVTNFIKQNRQTVRPIAEANFLLAIKHAQTLYHFQQGNLKESFEIALSQSPVGHKSKQGDLRLPEGSYRIVQKNSGPFSGKMAAWFGSGWMRINYPNPYDIQEGYRKSFISESQRISMTKAWYAGKAPNQKSRLGGGIGIHGWKGEWSNNKDRALTWGCISMHNSDLARLIKTVPLQTKIIILP